MLDKVWFFIGCDIKRAIEMYDVLFKGNHNDIVD